ncbi:dihydropteroate synthase [Marisediminicola sp. LYQ134]|uniref:dihydropteroate synthase n=1 Tax=Marisediminicola sp. LYQ134 TaxID=3391061 RepID=UPI0039834BAE
MAERRTTAGARRRPGRTASDERVADLVGSPATSRRARAMADRTTTPTRPVILGILNVTPDSFSDGGSHDDAASAIEFGVHLAESGADIIDVGGESTRPGAGRITVADELARITPVVRELVDRGIPVSIDTMNAATAEVAVGLGAVIVNDVSGGTADADMARVVADTGVLFVAMHSRGTSETMASLTDYADPVYDVLAELEHRVSALLARGVTPAQIIVDPGIGFAKTAEQNWKLLGSLTELAQLGHPLLVGASRKKFLAELLPTGAKPRKRDAATSIISALSADAGVWGLRVHDVAGTKAALDVWGAMRGVRE